MSWKERYCGCECNPIVNIAEILEEKLFNRAGHDDQAPGEHAGGADEEPDGGDKQSEKKIPEQIISGNAVI